MRILVKLYTDGYAEFDEESGRQITIVMARDEAYSYRLKYQVDDLALWAIEKADLDYLEKKNADRIFDLQSK